MENRTVVQWDKDDLDELGMLKVDVLALGMLTAIRKAFEFIDHLYGKKLTLATVPHDDAGVYKMLQAADSIGVFQVESRAQQSMLPRLKPAEFYDLVIEVAIVRPGPIQGDMVHPYLRRREKKEPVIIRAKNCAKYWKRPWVYRCFKSRRCKSQSSERVSLRMRRTSYDVRLQPSGTSGRFQRFGIVS